MAGWADRLWDVIKDDVIAFWRQIPQKLRLAFIGIALLAVLLAPFYKQVIEVLEQAPRGVRILLASEGEIPLSQGTRTRLNTFIDTLTADLDGRLKSLEAGEVSFTPWELAQITAGLQLTKESKYSGLVIDSINNQTTTECNCWKEISKGEPHLGATAWVLYAFGLLGEPADIEKYDYIMSQRKADGWWSLYPASDDDKNASTYATALAVLSLNEHLRNGLIEASVGSERAENIAFVVERGAAWLRSRKLEGTARWNDYPHGFNRKLSASLSGLVLFTLHRVTKDEDSLGILDSEWVSALPIQIPPSTESEFSNAKIWERGDLENPDHLDKTRHYKLPWILIATLQAYPQLIFRDRIRALTWIEETLESDIITPELINSVWIEGEVLLALQILRRRSGKP